MRLELNEGPGSLEYTREIRELIIRIKASFDPSISLMPSIRRSCWMIVQDLRLCMPPIPLDRVYREDVMLIGARPMDTPPIALGTRAPYKHLMDFVLGGKAVKPSYEWILLALDDAAPRGDDPSLWRKIEVSRELYDRRVEKEDEEDMRDLRSEFDKYLEVEGVAVGRGLKHYDFKGVPDLVP